MTQAMIDSAGGAVRVHWQDGEASAFPFLWLRDNCPSGFHPQTQERCFDLLSVPEDLAPDRVSVDQDALVVDWGDAQHVSRFSLEWLSVHRTGRVLDDPADVEMRHWRGDLARGDVPSADAVDLLGSDDALLEWLRAGRAFGLALVTGLDDHPDAGTSVARRVGFLRETNFGTVFDVISKPDPNNLAYTSHALPPHTDLPNQELPPGFQFLHCLANEASGGGSMFCDGFAVAADLRAEDVLSFDLLSRVEIPLRFHDGEADIRSRAPVICLKGDGSLDQIRFNPHIAGIFDMPAEHIAAYYRAYRRYMAATRDPKYLTTFRLAPGEMIVFDNRRVLHGREAFDPASGYRSLRGCYVDRGEWDSRIRVLSR